LSKVNAVRKKALEYVRKQDWQNATKEYKRLADLDQSNPNVFNELGDIYLKTGHKSEAYDSFSRAIDSYTRVSLHNNAVAVCKKVLRLIPSRYDVLIKLGIIRRKQGLVKEAESYYFSYFDKVLVDDQVGPQDVKKACDEIADEMGDSIAVLERTHECLVKFNLKEETSGVLNKLYATYAAEENQTELDRVAQLLNELGQKLPEAESAPAEVQKDGTVITEDNIWSASHSEGERIEVDDSMQQADSAPIAASKPESVYSYGDLQFGGQQPDNTNAPSEAENAGTTTQTMPPPKETPADPAVEEPVYDVTPKTEGETSAPPQDPAQADTPDTEAGQPPPTGGEASSETDTPDEKSSTGIVGSPNDIHVSAIIGDLDSEGSGELTEDDYRSHYDLGMAYLEMDLLPEAIREYQFASRSTTYQASALEMIGLCFLRQNQANLAIKQLTKGLQVIGPGDSEALGIKYNLGLAYEMAGDFDNAKSAFEDVYVEDVTFREVAEKIAKYT